MKNMILSSAICGKLVAPCIVCLLNIREKNLPPKRKICGIRGLNFQFNIIIKITWKRFMKYMELPPEEKDSLKTQFGYANLDEMLQKEYKEKYYCAK